MNFINRMYRHCFILIFLSYNVVCDNCVVFNLEKNFTENFTNKYPIICLGRPMWDHNQYSALPMESPHVNSTSFITPKSSLSCASSPVFSIAPEGTVDVRVFMKPAARSDQITIFVYQPLGSGMDIMVGSASLLAADPTLTRGWQTIKITVHGSNAFNGFVTLVGTASASSVILIDSVRYIPRTYNEELCPIYKQEVEDGLTTEAVMTTITTETNLITNPEPTSDDYLDVTSTNSSDTTEKISKTTSATNPELTTNNHLNTTATDSLDTTTESYSEIITATSPEPTTNNHESTNSTSSQDKTTDNQFETTSEATTVTSPEPSTDNYLSTTSISSPVVTTENYPEITTTTRPESSTDNPDRKSTKSLIMKILIKVISY